MAKQITIIGLGAGNMEQLPLGVCRLLKGDNKIYLRTKEHPVIRELEGEGLTYTSFDYVYERHDQFEDVYQEITQLLLGAAKSENIIYGVPGHPLVAEKTVQLLIEEGPKQNIEITIGGGQSFIDALFSAVKADPIEGFQLLDGTDLHLHDIRTTQHLIIGQVYDAYVASDVKLTLMEKYPDDYEVIIVTAAGSDKELIQKVPLFELDRQISLNNLTSLYIPPMKELLLKEFTTFREIISELRGPNGCPWDKKQTHQSLKKYLIEESYELLEAIDEDDIDHMIEELGDVLLQVMLHSQIGEDEGMFSIDDVIESISEKMIRRHPHVFGDRNVSNAEEVVKNWNEIKAEEKGKDERETSIVNQAGKGLPAIIRAFNLQKHASKLGFDWDHAKDAWEKVHEEIKEFEIEMTNEHKENQLEELGDLLFAIVNAARLLSIHPEEALEMANQKFIRRFSYIENYVKNSGKPFRAFTLDELDRIWNEAKVKGL
ncbi:nucleoside triphosphate pyrophosphohydrolase [Heyndrickxia sporothermodurans]|uniref:nucleoside triphosphate pyrophosphohydrolase n=1 Tax=Heyndrickxia sporothermodurans TaxID=46224 RepID=UPI000D34B604|nr:nucleoside triphosphate pyrophosphohydrolase [Heyndrickxia sporothermodurans]MBL5791873.1 nucleoside triphosphate pyrophosphohydrolase [Heyndrickxia sporothermodurans]MBL5853017.1 nucleoside triphosphate pyrophosphohydrolase [Heyndrickxia sporothermodurans]PTY77499.1 nucleoside triphosphate pyrophosphohydrolase [Heyndrickxia sporothermodurans]